MSGQNQESESKRATRNASNIEKKKEAKQVTKESSKFVTQGGQIFLIGSSQMSDGNSKSGNFNFDPKFRLDSTKQEMEGNYKG